MLTLNLKKVYFTTHGFDNMHVYLDDNGEKLGLTGVVAHDCEEQTFDHVGDNEQIIILVERIPFIRFEIIYAPLTDRYLLSSVSPISLRTYTEQKLKIEQWGDYESVKQCINKCISVSAGFVNRMGKEEENDGNYYKD